MNVYSLALLATALHAAPHPNPTDGGEYRGAERQLAVQLPRVAEAAVRIDGSLDEEVWSRAALLTGFTQTEPVEGAPASERTEVRVFYTPQALYVGVHAFAKDPSRIRSSLAERDRILRDDHVQILLDTFLDRRRAFAFYVNPLGIQQDGILNEGSARR
ncbi:MAG TPA: carbohydrate binding family 9 domain-containing protein, partial [Longimicrobiaceae bacterium]|nr:carbohydrate binding family 9 domain-containing protein [Longimicrobiaceae bacterium]